MTIVLDIRRSSSRKGTRLIQWQCDNHKLNQQFKLLPVEENIFQVQVIHSGQCLDVKASSTNDQAKITQWPCKPSLDVNPLNQYWKLEGYPDI